METAEERAAKEALDGCPWCGETGEFMQVLSGEWVARCGNRGCFVQPVTHPFPTRALAATAWNVRGGRAWIGSMADAGAASGVVAGAFAGYMAEV